MSWPRNSTVPDVCGMSPEMTLNSVVLPAPLGPRMARRSPYATSRSTSRTAWSPPNRRPTPRGRRTGSAGSVVTSGTAALPADDLHGSGLAEPRQVALLATGGFAARGRRRVAERAAERLVDARDAVDGLDGQLVALHVQLLVVHREHGLAVVVELDRAVRRGQLHLADRGLQLALVGDVALDRLEALDQAPGVDVVPVGERARRLRGGVAARRELLEPMADDVGRVALRGRRVQVARRAGAADVGARDARAELLELPRRAPEQVAHELLRVDRALRLLIRLQERDQPRAADGDERAVHVGGHLLRVGGVVGRVQRREDALRDLAARGAELGDEPGRRGPAEAVVVGHDRRLAPAELVVGQVAEARVPLRAVAVEAEEVRRLHLQRRVLRAGRAVDERLVRMLLGVVGHRDRLVARQRPDHDVGVELLHQPPGLLDRRVGAVVAAADADELERVAADRAAREAGLRVVRVLRRGAGELRQRGHRAGHVLLVERAECALALGHDGDLDGLARAAVARRDGRLRSGRVGGCRGRRRARGRARRARAAARRVAPLVVAAAARGHYERERGDGECEPERCSARTPECCHDLSLLLEDTDTSQPTGVGCADPLSWAMSPGIVRRRPAVARSHRPISPLGETSTMTRKMTPMSVWNRCATKWMSGA